MASPFEIPVAHIDDPESVAALLQALRAVHGPAYDFSVACWDGRVVLDAPDGRCAYRFVIEAEGAQIALEPGDRVRGPSSNGPYRTVNAPLAETTAPHAEAVWPGDAIGSGASLGAAELTGRGVYLEIVTEITAYPAPKLALLRNLPDIPGGCAAYPGAFRRETLPPERPAEHAPDRVGVNRVNEHTLDMRPDRTPPPTVHHHGAVAGPDGVPHNHTETAVILPRAAYGRPLVNNSEDGHAVIYRNPHRGTSDSFRVPVRPGCIVTTPATPDVVYGHCFENAFAMLVAVPGFVAPYERMEEQWRGKG